MLQKWMKCQGRLIKLCKGNEWTSSLLGVKNFSKLSFRFNMKPKSVWKSHFAQINRNNSTSGQKGILLYEEGSANKKLLFRGRLFVGIQLFGFLLAAETTHMVRTTDKIEQEVNRNVEVNMYTGEYGFMFLPVFVGCSLVITAIAFFGCSRLVKKVYYIPSTKQVRLITHSLFGGETAIASELGNITMTQSHAKVHGRRWVYIINGSGNVVNKRMFNFVMGSAGL